MSGLLVVEPIDVTADMLTDSDVFGNEYELWSAYLVYGMDNIVRVEPVGGIPSLYISLQDAHVGHDPLDSPDYWALMRPTNRWALLDDSITTRTTQPASMFYEFTPLTAVNCVYAGNMVGATSIRIRVTDPVQGVMYDQTTNLRGSPSGASWWQWTYGGRSPSSTQIVATDLPTSLEGVIRIDLEGTADMGIGILVLGRPAEFGTGVLVGYRAGIQDYSRKEANEFGDVYLVERAFAKRGSFSLVLANDEIDELQEYLASIRATPCLYVASTRFNATVIYGFFRNFEITIQYDLGSLCEFEIEGFT